MDPSTIPGKLQKFSFILLNRFDDAWYFEEDLVEKYKNWFLQLVKYFEGPLPLTRREELILHLSGHNDIHMVTYYPFDDHEAFLKETKHFR